MSKTTRERNTRFPVLKPTIIDQVTNKVVFIETQEELIQAAASNEKRQCRTEGIPFKIQSLLQGRYCKGNKKHQNSFKQNIYLSSNNRQVGKKVYKSVKNARLNIRKKYGQPKNHTSTTQERIEERKR